MKFLLTNDDGIDALGLQALAAAARQFGEVIQIAPVDAQSGCSHRVTAHQPLVLHTKSANRYALTGTPADCVRVGLHHLASDADWVLSGINHGGNLGADVYHSGTVAAVREAVLLERPGIAISHYQRRGQSINWDRAVRWLAPVLRQILEAGWVPGVFWNINLPHLEPGSPDPEVVNCSLQPGALPVSYVRDGDAFIYNGDYHLRTRAAGCDVDVCFQGNIAITRLTVHA